MESILEALQASFTTGAVSSNTANSSSRSSSNSSASSQQEVTPEELPLTWQYGGKLHRVPDGFRLVTKMTLQVLYSLWHEGIKTQRIGPFKHFDSHDVHKDDRKHLYSARALVAEIDKFLPTGFLAFSSSSRDAAFKIAFDQMVSSFHDTQIETNLKRKALEITAFTTLYTSFYLLSKKRKALIPVEPN